MAISYAVRIKTTNAEGKNRTITFQNMLATVDTDSELKGFAEALQPVLPETITSYEVVRTRALNDTLTAAVGTDGLPESTQDNTIYLLSNDVGNKRITISKSASAAESDTAAFTSYATAVYNFADQLTTYLVGDYTVEDVTLRAIYDTQVPES